MTTDITGKGLEPLIVRPIANPGSMNLTTSSPASGIVLFSQFG
jgi:hypothetical protein